MKKILVIALLTIFSVACIAQTSEPVTISSTALATTTVVPIPVETDLPVSTATLPALIATFDDPLCDLKGSFFLDGELYFTSQLATLLEQDVESSPSYAISLVGASTDGTSHFLTIWIRHRATPGPNEMQTLPEPFSDSDIRIYTLDNLVLHGDFEPVRLKLHVISAQIAEPSDDPLVYCDYVIEEIQRR